MLIHKKAIRIGILSSTFSLCFEMIILFEHFYINAQWKFMLLLIVTPIKGQRGNQQEMLRLRREILGKFSFYLDFFMGNF